MAGLFGYSMRGAGRGVMGALKDQRNLAPPPVTEKTSPTAQQPERRGLMGWLEGARGPGNTVERLNMFGAQLQDINDGGQRSDALRAQQEQMMAQQQAMQQRMEINKLAQGMNLSPAEQLIFNADPESFLKLLAERDNDSRDAAAKANEQGFLNTSRGVYRTGPNPGWQEQFPVEPDLDFGWRYDEATGNLEYIPGGPADPAYLGSRAASTRAPARPRASGGGSRPRSSPRAPIAASGIRWD